MKRSLLLGLAIGAVLALSACGTPPVAGPAGAASGVVSVSPTVELQGKIVTAIEEVTLIRHASTLALTDKKITLKQDQDAQAALSAIRSILVTANGKSSLDPAGAAQLLSQALLALAAYQGAHP